MGWALALLLFASCATHLALVVGLARRRMGWAALGSLVLPPLAPWWGWRCRMRARAVAWTAAVLLYAVGVLISRA